MSIKTILLGLSLRGPDVLPGPKQSPVTRGDCFAKGRLAVTILLFLLLTACAAPQVSQRDITVSVWADGAQEQVEVPAGSTVDQALEQAQIVLADNDRVEPPGFTILGDGDSVTVTRVEEVFETVEEPIPFEQQTVRSDSLAAGEKRLLQSGSNGLREITIRRVLEDGEMVSESVVRSTILQEPQAEIVMIGAQNPFAPLAVPGRLVYLSGGNAWMIEESTAGRVPLVTSGDLDGRVFDLSPDGRWLLFTRKSDLPPDEEINSLWALSLDSSDAEPVDLGGRNIVHYAGFSPMDRDTAFFSTVEPRGTSPGWQANNDLYSVTFTATRANKPRLILDANSGGIYGWWGTAFAWSDDRHLAYSRPDGIGLVTFNREGMGVLRPLVEITPLNTRSDWAWVPGFAWGADSQTIFVVTHAAPGGLVSPEESPNFDLSGVSLVNGASIQIIPQTGMFAYPSVSPLDKSNREAGYRVAYLAATSPTQSITSRYRLVAMDRDGSNRRILFPDADSTGLEPQIPAWSPEPLANGSLFLAVIYKGDLWLVDSLTGEAQQVTGDGLLTRVDWE